MEAIAVKMVSFKYTDKKADDNSQSITGFYR